MAENHLSHFVGITKYTTLHPDEASACAAFN